MFWRRKQEPTRARVDYDGIGSEVGVEEILVQAAQSIDGAAMLAAYHGNSEGLLQAAECWTKLADFMVALGDHSDKKNTDKKRSDFLTGFQANKEDENARD